MDFLKINLWFSAISGIWESYASDADPEIQCCGSGMFIPDPDFYPSRIPDLGSRIQKQQQKRDVKKN
jgi:hypothetical protein